MNITHQEFYAKLLLAILSGTILIAFAVSGSAQEKIRLSYSALSPSTAFLWIPKEKGFLRNMDWTSKFCSSRAAP